MKRTLLRIALPVLILAVGAAGTMLLIQARGDEAKQPPRVSRPLVRVEEAQPQDLQLRVSAQGTVAPHTETELYAEVSGVVQVTSDSLKEGRFFEAGDVLVQIDPRDLELALTSAKSRLTQAKLALALEEAEAASAIEEWKNIAPGKKPPPLATREPHLADARAKVAAAEAELERAERDLERTTVKGPYAGRVRETFVDLGQFVNRGTLLARVYAIDRAEVRLPLHDEDLAYLNLPLSYHRPDTRDARAAEGNPTPVPGSEPTQRAATVRVEVRARFAGKTHMWNGQIVRTEGELDARSRMVHVIAQVMEPYAPGPSGRPPLLVGMFVTAEILGQQLHDVIVVPRSALRGDRVIIVDDADRLRFRDVDIARTERDRVLVRSGIEPGERICLTPLGAVSDGMHVRVVADGAIGDDK